MKRKSKNTGRAISMALAASMAVAPINVLAASTDIHGHWAEKTITEWQDKGLISGYQDGTFKPNKPTTRAEFTRIMNQALGLNSKGNVAFSDVSVNDWFYNDIAIALGEAYTAGYPDGTFKPNETITRAQAAVFIAKAIEATGGSVENFTDSADIPAWAKDSVAAIVEKGYMSGYPDGTFKPNAVLTRAEAISTLNRIMGIVVAPEEEETEKDVIVDKDDTKLKDQTIEGNLIISEKVGDGEVYLDNVEVKGDIIVKGGGDDSIYLKDTKVLGKAVMDKKNVRLQVSGKTELSKIVVKQACNLQEKDFTGEVKTISIVEPISDKITVGVNAEKLIVEDKSTLVINKNIDDIVIENGAKDTKLEIGKGAKIATVTADGKVAISGSGTVAKLEANVDGITVATTTTVTKTDTASGVKEPTKPATSGGGGGSSSSSHTQVNVSAITVTGEDDAEEVQNGQTLQMVADVQPNNASNKSVTWTVEAGTGTATIDANGLLTATGVGTVTVKATAQDGSEVVGEKVITIEPEADTYAVTVTAENGTVTGAGDYEEGAEVTLEATPAEDYVFVNWTDADGEVSTDNPYTFTMGTEAVELTANFEEVEVDKEALQTAINDANALIEEDYTEATWTDLQAALSAAQAVLADENATQEVVNTALNNLETTIEGLVEKAKVDFIKLSGTNYESLKEAGLTFTVSYQEHAPYDKLGVIRVTGAITQEKLEELNDQNQVDLSVWVKAPVGADRLTGGGYENATTWDNTGEGYWSTLNPLFVKNGEKFEVIETEGTQGIFSFDAKWFDDEGVILHQAITIDARNVTITEQ